MKDAWFTVQEIDDTTFAISEYGHWEKVHSFLLLGTDKAVLIDTGLGIDSIRRITDQLTTLSIDVITTTHVHVDHICSHGEFERIFVHENDKKWLEEGIEGLTLQQIRVDIGRGITIPTPSHFCTDTFKPYQGKASGLLQDGDQLYLGNRKLVIYHTPGHSPGHLSIFDELNGYLFTGDLLYAETPIYAFYPSTSPVDLVNSLEKLTKISNVSMIFGSHNTLGIDPSILTEVKRAVSYLRENDLASFGTGIHQFKGFSIQF